MAIATGSKAPDFTLIHKNDSGLSDVTLSDNFGKAATVLIFFPFAFSGPCEKELCSIRDSISEYKNLDAQVYGISTDFPFALAAFASSLNVDFPLLSDCNKEVSASYDVLFEEALGMKGVAKRSAVVISKFGEVIYSESSEDLGQWPDFDAIKAALG
ncbi:MAG TPA: peroxiredoxin [Opitutae bacterium]|nr:peroxiredoxin [Opitutae bacterium]|tara:strand:- start:678 stop:1148 length:471 start_codon:yes stop_codon:yes gene_type:complete